MSQGCVGMAFYHRIPKQGQEVWREIGLSCRCCSRALRYLWQEFLF